MKAEISPKFAAAASRRAIAGLLLLCLLLLSACAPLVRSEQGAYPELQPLEAGGTAGQTFQAHYGGLSGLAVYLKAPQPGPGSLVLHLRSSPGAAQDLHTAELPLERLQEPGFARFTFPALPDSTGKDYYASLELRGEGRVQYGTAPGDSYLHGALYRDGSAQEAQLAFRLVYEPGPLLLGLLGEGLRWLGYLLAGAFLFVLPGWALLDGLLPGWGGLRWGERAGLAAGASLAVYPLLLLWTGLIGLHLGPLYAWLPPLAGAAWLAGRALLAGRAWRSRRGKAASPAAEPFESEPAPPAGGAQPAAPPGSNHSYAQDRPGRVWGERWAGLALALLLALLFALRFWNVRGLDLPLFGDSYQHSLMAQLILDRGGLFQDWLPYAELYSFTYHFGFHSLAAVFAWVTGLQAPQALIWSGQILNGLAALALVPLAVKIGKSPWAGPAALLAAGLLSPMPAAYANWGRYTQLAGQTLLPAAVFVSWLALERAAPLRRSRGLYLLAWVLLGGLALTHYIVLIYAVLFFAAWLLLSLPGPGGLRLAWRRLRQGAGRTALLGAGGALLFLPWFINLFIGRILVNFGRSLSASPGQTAAAGAAGTIGNLFEYLPAGLWLLLPVLLAWGLWRRARGAALLALWWFLVFLAANPHWLNLPGRGAISNFAVFIAAYIPAAVLCGAALGWGVEALACRLAGETRPAPGWARLAPALLAALLLGGGLLFARPRLRDVQPARFALATRPDLRAAAWVRANTPPEARFLVNAFFAYNDSLTAGSDGGWWLPYLGGRLSTLPPLTYGVEQGPLPNHIRWTNAVAAAILEKGVDHPEVLRLLQERGVTHAYIGQQQGGVNSPGPLLPVEALLASPHYRPVYHQDRVWIFEIVGEP